MAFSFPKSETRTPTPNAVFCLTPPSGSERQLMAAGEHGGDERLPRRGAQAIDNVGEAAHVTTLTCKWYAIKAIQFTVFL